MFYRWQSVKEIVEATERQFGLKDPLRTMLLLCACSLLAACTGSNRPMPAIQSQLPDVAGARVSGAAGKYIKHIIVIIQENRTFDNLFRGFPRANAPAYGYQGAKRILLKPLRLTDGGFIDNKWQSTLAAWDNGKMDGFGGPNPYGQPIDLPYAYVPKNEIGPYWTLASRYVLADRMFPTQLGASFSAHLDLIDGNTQLKPGRMAEADPPAGSFWGCNAAVGTRSFVVDRARQESNDGPFPCFTHFKTLADTLDAAHTSWRFYAPAVGVEGEVWSTFAEIRQVYYGRDWDNVVSPETTVLTDLKNGNFPGVVWVVPDYNNSDHQGSHSDTGPSWVAAIVNAVGESEYWRSSAIFLVWDDWGGFYDNVPPPQLDYLGLGIRVPCLVISPYSRIAKGKKEGYLSHTTYEFGSILKFVEETFNLPPLGTEAEGYTDVRAKSLDDTFDFNQKPRSFTPIPAKYPASYFLEEKPSLKPPDDD
jgi:phospholipase C